MGRRTWIDSDIWRDTRKLSTLERELYFRLLVNENGNITGYYRLNIPHLANDMKLSEEELIVMLKKEKKFWKYDEETEQVLIPRYTKYNVVRGASQIKKLNAELAALTPCKLHKEFVKAWCENEGIGAEKLIDAKIKMD